MGEQLLIRYEFHVSRQAREKYQFDDSLFSLSGNVIFANFHAVRKFAQKINNRRDLFLHPEETIRAGQLNAMGLIDEILHLVFQSYRQQRNSQVVGEALSWLETVYSGHQVDVALYSFVELFPPLVVYRSEISARDYINAVSILEDGTSVPNRQIVLEEMLLLWLANVNPAFSPFLEIFADASLAKNTIYLNMITSLGEFFNAQPPFGPDNQSLIDMLRSPAIAEPNSLSGQLEYIRTRWGYLLTKHIIRLLTSMDLIKEEEKAIFPGSGPSYVYEFKDLESETERFSPDKEWMPSVVMLAKNSYVWLDQLSKKYGASINRLDLIPEAELDKLASWGFTGLWLIGLWERSAASKTIKQLRGNPDAVASAYSLHAYDIAQDLGGEQAFKKLQDRAWQRGIRLASDMVPNHMGIDSRWLIEHPDWFISLAYSPFPAYSFNGPNLSGDERVGIYLEDHYYDSSDAAVVFKHVDFWTGSEIYIYHGNDGTSMPWNDTGQLNYLKPDVREAVIQTILHVARKFPIIRFDAAMTLTKRHYQRLWYPEPGSGGDIPSRSEHGLSKQQFDQVFPEEFWREVVDRVAQEVPDTLLLAEAFWLMEGYFVRTLGMHRVYNSAFMNMLRDEKNQEYRLVMKNTLEFDPEILKRYVNFMNNPDERTAVDQFGKGDKYFGICTLLATMPGLPMFGHGQIEGYTEKYGMEFRKPLLDETEDSYLIERHEREIFPLLRRRYLFAEVSNFLLYDFYSPEGNVNEDVFAYSNRVGDERTLVVYHNKYSNASGWIRLSAAFPVKTGIMDERVLVQKNLGEGLDLRNEEFIFTIFTDQISGLEYIRGNCELHNHGLYIELQAYKYHVFLGFRQVEDDENHSYAQLAQYLNGAGVPDIEAAFQEVLLEPILTPFRELVNPGMFNWLIQNRYGSPDFNQENYENMLLETRHKIKTLFERISLRAGGVNDPDILSVEIERMLSMALALPNLNGAWLNFRDNTADQEDLELDTSLKAFQYLQAGADGNFPLQNGDAIVWGILLSWLFTYPLGKICTQMDYEEFSRTWIDEWLFGRVISETLSKMGCDKQTSDRLVGLIRVLNSNPACLTRHTREELDPHRILRTLFQDGEMQRYVKVHRFQGVLWFNKEAFEETLWYLFITSVVHLGDAHGIEIDASESNQSDQEDKYRQLSDAIQESYQAVTTLLKAQDQSKFQVQKLLEIVKE